MSFDPSDARNEGRGPSRRGAPKEQPAVSITQQYRERHNMTYELGCVGHAFIVRIFFPLDDAPDAWRIEARAKDGGDALVVTATAGSRELSLTRVAEAWQVHASEGRLPPIDWAATGLALKAVRAV